MGSNTHNCMGEGGGQFEPCICFPLPIGIFLNWKFTYLSWLRQHQTGISFLSKQCYNGENTVQVFFALHAPSLLPTIQFGLKSDCFIGLGSWSFLKNFYDKVLYKLGSSRADRQYKEEETCLRSLLGCWSRWSRRRSRSLH